MLQPDRARARRLPSPLLRLAVLLAAFFVTVPAFAQVKVAVVDMRRAMMETEEGLRVSATLKKLFDARQTELDAKQRTLQTEREALEKENAAGKTSKEVLQKKLEAWQKQALELQNALVESQREMQRMDSELTTPILTRLVAVVKKIATTDGYEMVLDKSVVPYFRGDLELTDRAIQMYNAAHAGDAPTSPAPGKPAAAPAKPAPTKPAAPKK